MSILSVLKNFSSIAVGSIVFVGAIGSTIIIGNKPVDAASVGYINSDDGSSIDYLNAYGNTVTYLNNPLGLTLGDLSTFDTVIVASNYPFSQPTNIGNVLAQFANAGGGVVLTEFVFQGQWALSGAIMNTGYSPFTIDPLSSGYGINSNLGTIYNPSSSIFNGVNTANVQTSFQANVGLDTGANLVADWASGRHAIAYNVLANSSVVGLNLFPASYWTSDIDTQKLVANAINLSLKGQIGRAHV